MWDRLTLERELAQLGVRETADMHGLREYQIPTQSRQPSIEVKDWNESLRVSHVKLTAAATPDYMTIQGYVRDEKVFPLNLRDPRRMRIGAGDHARDREGKVVINLTIEYEGHGKVPRSSKVARAKVATKLALKFLCTPEGGIELDREVPRRTDRSRNDDLGIDIEVYQRKYKSKNKPFYPRDRVPISVWDEWMKIFRILRVVIIVKLTVTKTGAGWVTVDLKDPSVPIPDPIKAGSTGPRTAELGPMIIDLVPDGARPPLTAKQGVSENFYFGVDSSELDRVVDEPNGRIHQGNKLDAWIRDDLIARWDVHEALYRGELPVRGEARASATLKGKGKSSQEFLRYLKSLSEKRRTEVLQGLLAYNQKRSEERRDAVANRLKRTRSPLGGNLLPSPEQQIQIRAIGASATRIPTGLAHLIDVATSGSGLGEETVNERRCLIHIHAADLDAAIKKLYGVPVDRWYLPE